MLKRIVSTLALVSIIAIVCFFFVAGRLMDQRMNVCLHIDDEDYSISPKAKAIQQEALIADWHSDLLLWDRSVLNRATHGHTDLPRLIEGNFTLQVFDAVIKTPKGQNYERNNGETDNITLLAAANRWPIKSWTNLTERALYQSYKLHKAERESNGQLKIVRSSVDLETIIKQKTDSLVVVGGLLSIEGLHALEGQIENVDRLYDAGYRMFGLVHFFDNKVGGSSAGEEQYGLTPFGEEVISAMLEKNIIIDLAHSSSQLIDDVLAYTDSPVVVSHTGVMGTYNSPRNLSDEHIRRIAERGGMIGVGFWDGAVGSPDPKNIVNAIKYIAELVGVDHICLGSDWDGGTTTYFDAAHIGLLIDELIEANFSKEEIEKIIGGNQIDFLLQHLPVD